MSALGEHAQEYLRARRALGVKLERHGRLLPQLLTYLEAAGASTVTRELAISWARLPAGAHPRHWAARLSLARGFAAYLRTIDPSTEIPPAGVFAVRYQRPTPYLWSQHDISRLLDAAGGLRPPLKAASYEALFGLLAVTGMRLGEAIALGPGDVDLDNGVITIHAQNAKLERARLVPLHPTTVQGSSATWIRERGYAHGRDRTRSCSPALVRTSIAAPSPRHCARSPPRSACGPTPFTRPRTISDTASLFAR
jgi:integrase